MIKFAEFLVTSVIKIGWIRIRSLTNQVHIEQRNKYPRAFAEHHKYRVSSNPGVVSLHSDNYNFLLKKGISYNYFEVN